MRLAHRIDTYSYQPHREIAHHNYDRHQVEYRHLLDVRPIEDVYVVCRNRVRNFHVKVLKDKEVEQFRCHRCFEANS